MSSTKAVSVDYSISKIFRQSTTSPVPIVWLGRGLLSSFLAQVAEIEYDEKAMFEKPCKNNRLTKIFDRLAYPNIQPSNN